MLDAALQDGTALRPSVFEVFARRLPAGQIGSSGEIALAAARSLMDLASDDARSDTSKHDIGGDLIPELVSKGEANVYDFTTNVVPGDTQDNSHYWRDVGTLDSYFAANMDLVQPEPIFNLYNPSWPIFSYSRNLPPAKFVADWRSGDPFAGGPIHRGLGPGR